jgi:hypothetical protein
MYLTNKSARKTETRVRECDSRCATSAARSLQGRLDIGLCLVDVNFLAPKIESLRVGSENTRAIFWKMTSDFD